MSHLNVNIIAIFNSPCKTMWVPLKNRKKWWPWAHAHYKRWSTVSRKNTPVSPFKTRVVQKTDTPCFIRLFICLSFIRYWPIFKVISHQNICNNTVTKDPTTPQVCRYTTLWNVSVLKATTENKTTSVTTHFKSASYGSKVDTLNIWTITAGCDSNFR